ncbi:hypothetical protein FB567DRAFT_535429 [Paraphoma chrysanthemicola]|uniref:Extracellular membrane protein CFEM domain-containing protein n=1 Tax=Paraphoma chrysanthemicola TaxID=798071 RepID=A0A8K0QW34_9PLEO|nr:hypothetical protein FB567DRAFT_535429 [Paraphoma chrysanthemicola]
MQFFTTIALAALALTASACKCVQGGTNDAATATCCTSLGGRQEGNDCVADTISEELSDFRQCCRNQDPSGELTSDCDFPTKRDENSAAIKKRAPKVVEVRSAGAIMTVVS